MPTLGCAPVTPGIVEEQFGSNLDGLRFAETPVVDAAHSALLGRHRVRRADRVRSGPDDGGVAVGADRVERELRMGASCCN